MWRDFPYEGSSYVMVLSKSSHGKRLPMGKTFTWEMPSQGEDVHIGNALTWRRQSHGKPFTWGSFSMGPWDPWAKNTCESHGDYLHMRKVRAWDSHDVPWDKGSSMGFLDWVWRAKT